MEKILISDGKILIRDKQTGSATLVFWIRFFTFKPNLCSSALSSGVNSFCTKKLDVNFSTNSTTSYIKHRSLGEDFWTRSYESSAQIPPPQVPLKNITDKPGCSLILRTLNNESVV